MVRPQTSEEKPRMAHIRLDPETHRRLRMVVAANDTSMQDWLADRVGKAVDAEWPTIANEASRP